MASSSQYQGSHIGLIYHPLPEEHRNYHTYTGTQLSLRVQQIITRLIEAIKRGLLRIFPLPRIVLYLFAIVVACTLIGCATPKQVTQLVRDTRVDTLYLSNTQYDSIYVYQERFHDRTRDTIYLKDVSIEYRYKLLRDTVRVIQRDSIPYQVTVTEVKEITRPLIAFDQLTRLVFWFVFGYILSIVVFKLRSVFSQ